MSAFEVTSDKLPLAAIAPPLTDALLSKYGSMILALPDSAIRDAMAACMTCCKAWWQLPESDRQNESQRWSVTHKGEDKVITLVPLRKDHEKLLDEHIPWPHEIAGIQALFDGISNETERDLRDAAFHLLWHVIELNHGREPFTQDKL